MAFNSFLEAVGVPNRSKETLARLDEISTTLAGVAREVSEINRRVSALATQLQISHLKLASTAQENRMSSAIANIRTHYGRKGKTAGAKGKTSGRYVPEILSLSDWVARRRGGETSTILNRLTQMFRT